MNTNKATIITPNQLESGATIPQALDNQYVPDSIYKEIISKRKDFNDPYVSKEKSKNSRNEFIRSLIYSAQVVVNRAFITNNELLYKFYLPGNEFGAVSFASMLNTGIIVPYLFKEKTLFESTEFDRSTEGERAAEYLSQFLTNNIKCVRFSADDHVNNERLTRFTFNFRKYFSSLPLLDDKLRIEMLGELSGGKKEIGNEQLEFKRHLKILSRYVEDKFDEDGSVTRNDLYSKFLTDPASTVSDGCYLPPDTSNPYRLEIKKLIDLKYNTNLPDMLGRYSFTPSEMPTRSALQDDSQISDIDANRVERFIEEDLSPLVKGQRIFMANAQRAMILPILSNLTLSDVLEIRQINSWTRFISLQNKILSEPLSIGDNYESFQSSFEIFQRDLSNWYVEKYGIDKIKEKYESIATIVLGLAGRTVIYGMSELDLVTKVALGELPTIAKGITVKLMMNVVNPLTRRINKERSYSIEIMRSELELTENEARRIMEHTKGYLLPLSESLVAEQDRN